VKVTSAKQPQSSSPFKDAGQKVYGLGYHLLVLVYTKTDLPQDKSVDMKFTSVVFVHKTQTADFQTTKGIRELLERKANVEDLTAFLLERNLPLDDIGAQELAARILATPPAQGYLTISNALQWRLQYQRVLELALTNQTEGVVNLLR
jgi:restriction system protein